MSYPCQSSICHYFSARHLHPFYSPFFFFNDTATTEIYTLSLHDALPICTTARSRADVTAMTSAWYPAARSEDRKSTRLNSSHPSISYAVFCLKKKKKKKITITLERYLLINSFRANNIVRMYT